MLLEILNSLSKITIQCADVFLTGTYLNGFGWTVHDMGAIVSAANLAGLSFSDSLGQSCDYSLGKLQFLADGFSDGGSND